MMCAQTTSRLLYCGIMKASSNMSSPQSPISSATSQVQYCLFSLRLSSSWGRDSAVGVATRYGLDGPGIESRWGARFSAPVQTGPGAYPASCTMGTGSFPGVKRPGCGADHPPPSKCRGHERVGLYFYSPSGPSWPVIEKANQPTNQPTNRHNEAHSTSSFICLRHLKQVTSFIFKYLQFKSLRCTSGIAYDNRDC